MEPGQITPIDPELVTIYTLPKELEEISKEYFFTGSRVICNPPVMNTDLDICIYPKDYSAATLTLVQNGYVLSNNVTLQRYDTQGLLTSFRKNELNVLLFRSYKGFSQWGYLTKLSKSLNLVEKKDRTNIFKLGLYGRMLVAENDAKLLAPYDDYDRRPQIQQPRAIPVAPYLRAGNNTYTTLRDVLTENDRNAFRVFTEEEVFNEPLEVRFETDGPQQDEFEEEIDEEAIEEMEIEIEEEEEERDEDAF